MTYLPLVNLDHPLASPLRVRVCGTFFCRLRGLMFAPPLALGEGLLLDQKRCSRLNAGIHMLFMRTDLTVVWADEHKVVVDIRLARRWRPVYLPVKPARYVLELSPARFLEFRIGDRLQFDETKLD